MFKKKLVLVIVVMMCHHIYEYGGFERWSPLKVQRFSGKHLIVAAFLRSLTRANLEMEIKNRKPRFLINDIQNFSMSISHACYIIQKLQEAFHELGFHTYAPSRYENDPAKRDYQQAVFAFYNFRNNIDLYEMPSASDWNVLTRNREALLRAFETGDEQKVLQCYKLPYIMKRQTFNSKKLRKCGCVVL